MPRASAALTLALPVVASLLAAQLESLIPIAPVGSLLEDDAAIP